jgi:hypothetical protein
MKNTANTKYIFIYEIDDKTILYATELKQKKHKLTIVGICGVFFGVLNPSLVNPTNATYGSIM